MEREITGFGAFVMLMFFWFIALSTWNDKVVEARGSKVVGLLFVTAILGGVWWQTCF